MIEDLNRAVKSNSYMIAIWRVEDGVTHLDRHTMNFPYQDFYTAVKLLREDLEKESGLGLLLPPLEFINGQLG